MSVKEQVEKLIAPKLAELGYELVEVSYVKQYHGMALNIVIDTDKEGGIGLDDCETVSNAIDPLLEESNPTSDAAYTLNVSSPGLDRPLKTERDFKKKLGQEVEVSLYQAAGGAKKHIGILKTFDVDSITITDKEDKKFLLKDIAVVKPVIKF